MILDLVVLGRQVRQARLAAGLTQRELADKLGISPAAISQVERAETAPALAKLAEIANALDVTIGMLLGDRLAVAEHLIGQVRAQVRVLGYDLALIPWQEGA